MSPLCDAKLETLVDLKLGVWTPATSTELPEPFEYVVCELVPNCMPLLANTSRIIASM
jgi:hypothetical protein